MTQIWKKEELDEMQNDTSFTHTNKNYKIYRTNFYLILFFFAQVLRQYQGILKHDITAENEALTHIRPGLDTMKIMQ